MGPCRGKTTAVASGRRVLAGGEGLAGDDLALRDLHDLLCPRVGDVRQDKCRRQGVAEAVTARSWSRRGAGEHGGTRRA
jgi:hypothetical protein